MQNLNNLHKMKKDSYESSRLNQTCIISSEFIPESGSMLGTAAEAKRVEAVNLLRNVLAYPDKLDSPCPEFWDWLPLAYRDGDTGCSAKFTKYNMEVAFLAGKESAQTTTSQQWVGLTDEEMDELVDRYCTL